MKPVLLFDVNETLLDLSALDEPFARVFGDASVRSAWFAQMLQLGFVGTITSQYVDFTTAQRAALEMLARRRGVTLAPSDADEVIDTMAHLPAHADVPEALERLTAAGFRVAALTNSVGRVAEAQLSNAGIRAWFEAVFSADDVRQLKPAPEPYRMAARGMGCDIADTCLIAAHAWDVAGALAAGCQAAFIARPGAIPSPLGRSPDIVASDLRELAALLLERWG